MPRPPPCPKIERVAVLFHPHRRVVGNLRRSLLPTLEFLASRTEVSVDAGKEVSRATRSKLEALGVRFGPRAAIMAGCDLVITYGGDGSLIAAASEVQDARTCLLGINAGGLGFLTEASLEEGPQVVRDIFEGRAWLDRRMKLTASVFRGARQVFSWDAMNDVVVRQGRTNALLELDAYIDGVELITFRADGVVAATPSGSTAYALSAGGPIVHPSLECIELAPIAAFTLSARPILVPPKGVVQLDLKSRHHDATLTFDGQKVIGLETEDRVEIRQGRVPANFLRVRRDDYYRILKEKLGWHRERS